MSNVGLRAATYVLWVLCSYACSLPFWVVHAVVNCDARYPSYDRQKAITLTRLSITYDYAWSHYDSATPRT